MKVSAKRLYTLLRDWLADATTGLGLRLGLASAVVVSVIITVGAMFAYRGEKAHLLHVMRGAALIQGQLVLTGLRAAMLENNRSLLTDLVVEYAKGTGVERIYLVDATGRVALATEAELIDRYVQMPTDVCPTCPVAPDAAHTHWIVLPPDDESVMRSFTLVTNESRCHRCHPAEQTLLGVLGVEFSTAPLQQARASMIVRTLEWGTGTFVLVLLAVGAVVQIGALRRIRSIRHSARSLVVAAAAPPLSPRRDEIGELARDIRRASLSLQKSKDEVDLQRRLLVDLIDRMDDGIAIFDGELHVVAANKSYLDRIQLARAQLDSPKRRAMRTGRVEKDLYRFAVGEREVCYEVYASPMTEESGRVEHLVEVWRDVSERVHLEANLAHSEQLASIGVLASGFSHEISTPLATIATAIQGILRQLRNAENLGPEAVEDLRARLTTASDEAFRCRDITRSLLNLSHPRRMVIERVDAAAIAARMLDVVRPMAEQHNVTISSELNGELPAVRGHRDQLEQLMLNLYINAVEAMMAKGGTLEVKAAAVDGHLEIHVRDSGPGIAPSDRQRVFEPFFSRKTGGTGLGLYLGRQVVEAHDGRLDIIESSTHGTCIRVVLPKAAGVESESGQGSEQQ